jgi:pyruvate dehydrogenase E1 component
MPEMPAGAEEGIIQGLYKLNSVDVPGSQHKVQIMGAGALVRSALEAQQILAERFGVASSVWSATSFTQLRRDAQAARRWNMLHPTEPPRKSYLESVLADESGLFVAVSDYVCALAEQIAPWIPGEFFALGTDGMGRSDSREALRRHFEVDAPSIVVATLYRLHRQGAIEAGEVQRAIRELGVDPEKADPLTA